MADSLAAAFAEVEGPELDAIVGYSIAPRKAAPTDRAIVEAFRGFDYSRIRRIARQLASRYRCHETHAEDAVQDALLSLYERRPGLYRESPDGWLGLVYQVARFRVIDTKTRQHQTVSIEELVEAAGDAPFVDARPCVAPSPEADEDSRYQPSPLKGEPWTRAQIIGAFQRFRDFYGRPPRVKECRTMHRLPSPTTIHRHFRRFGDAVLAAGMVPITVERRHKRWAPAEAAAACASFRRRHGYWPSWADVKRDARGLPCTSVMIRFFGGTRSADVQTGAEAILYGLEREDP